MPNAESKTVYKDERMAAKEMKRIRGRFPDPVLRLAPFVVNLGVDVRDALLSAKQTRGCSLQVLSGQRQDLSNRLSLKRFAK